MPSRYLLAHELPNFIGSFIADSTSDDRRPARRHFVKNTDVEVTVESQRKSSGNWSRGHDQNVRFFSNVCLGVRAVATSSVHVGTAALGRPVEQSSTTA